MKYKWIFNSLMLLSGIGISSHYISNSIINNTSIRYATNNNNENIEMYSDLNNPRNMDVYIIEDIAKLDTTNHDFHLNGNVVYNQYKEFAHWGWFNEWKGTYDYGFLKSITPEIRIKAVINNKSIDTFNYSWNNDGLNVLGNINIASINTNYGRFVNNSKPTFTITLSNRTIPEVNTNFLYNNKNNINVESEKILDNLGKKSIINYFYQSLDINKIKNSLINDFNSRANTNGENFPHANYSWYYNVNKRYGMGYTTSWYATQGRRAVQAYTDFGHIDSDVINQLEQAKIGSVELSQRLFNKLIKVNLDDLKFSDNNDKIWNSNTIINNTKNVLGFSEIFWNFKVFDYAKSLLDRINNEVIKVCHGKTIDLYKPLSNPIDSDWTNMWANLSWDDNLGYSKSAVSGFVEAINKLEFPDLATLENTAYIFFSEPNHPFKSMPLGDGSYADIRKNIYNDVFYYNFENNQDILNKWTLNDLSGLYQSFINFFKSHDIVLNVSVANRDKIGTPFEPVYDIDSNGNYIKKEIKLWDAESFNWNYAFINDIGEQYIDWNILEFRIDNIKAVDSIFKTSSNIVSIKDKNNIEIDFKKDYFSLKYRFNASPFDLLVLSNYYDPKYFKYFSIFSEYTINQFVNLYNDEKEIINEEGEIEKIKTYVNDFVESKKYNPKNIILKSLNDNLKAFVTNVPGWENPRNGYSIFKEIICGIGIGDLNKYFNFESDQPFFNLDSWKNALSRFQIDVDKKYKKYPIFASSYSNNTIYAIATIPNWKYEDGSYGDFEAIHHIIKNSRFKYDKNTATWEPDFSFNAIAEIEPYTRYKDNGTWDNKGYFLIKLNVGYKGGGWGAGYAKRSSYQVTNWKEIEKQYIMPKNENPNVLYPYENAGIMEFLTSRKEDGSLIFWKNDLKKITNETFFSIEEYYINDWKLDTDLVFKSLGIDDFNNKKYRYLIDSGINWIKYSNKYSADEKSKILNSLYTYKGEKEFIKQSLDWYFRNGMIKVDISNYWFSNIELLRNDKIFSYLLDFYGFKFDDIFMKEYILVEGQNTNQYRLVPNSKNFKNGFSFDNFTNNTKIITNNMNNLMFSNKKDESIVSLRLPNKLINELIETNYISPPNEWNDINYNPYDQESIFLKNPIMAIWATEGVYQNLNGDNYFNGKLIKQQYKKYTKALNVALISLSPIALIILVVFILIIFKIVSSKLGKKK